MRPRPLPKDLRTRSFDVHAADRAAVHRERLRRRDLVRPTRSLRWHRHRPLTGIDRIRAFRPVLGPGQFISHLSAAVLWGLPLPRGHPGDDPVHVTSVRPAAQMRRAGVVGHRTTEDRARVVTRWGMPTSAPATTWVECGAVLGLDDLVVLGDAVLASRACATSVEDLVSALSARGRCPGVRALRAALVLVRPGSGSPQETRARLGIVRAGLPEPGGQVEIRDERGRFVGRADFAYRRERIVIEYEGDQHRTDRAQWESDLRRYRAFERLGWTVLRWSRADITTHRVEALAELAGLLRRRG
ncbi:hypothetical protein DEJ23_06260 [Curtobacterium sp. MCSS17_008]|uniref:endonuclease domain-containing protein n=1 Tax=Curtobacterium sp. MCSS17_008 TaxID=2175647 RepID=UPI000DA8171A|nr:DUF559 domain-containing protein [Curtobacterium sp. MCSS17_008]PZF57740.1 hypothetical protein DEJ23_06260 [Curtobacterium sp. MCSS17_008]